MTSVDHEAVSLEHGINFVATGDADWPQIGRDERGYFRHQCLPAFDRIATQFGELAARGEQLFGIVRVGNWGGLFSCERYGVPFAIAVPQPASAWSNGQPVCEEDRLLLNRWRLRLGLPIMPGPTIPEPAETTIGLFPDWFGWDESERLPNGICVGFPLFERRDLQLPADIQQLIDEEGKLVVFTAGTGVQDIDKFARVARQFQELSGRPVLLLSHYHHECRYPETRLFRVLPFLDHATLFPSAAAIIHNGGIGTVAQAIRAGVPQIVVPLVWDQPDNAARIKALGLGDWIALGDLSAAAVANTIDLLERMDRRRLILAQAAVSSQNAISAAADEIERVMRARAMT
jgi:hypothetical protein